ncbi:MAG: hypothetical protein ACTHJ3_16475 [Pararhizobium sp.]
MDALKRLKAEIREIDAWADTAFERAAEEERRRRARVDTRRCRLPSCRRHRLCMAVIERDSVLGCLLMSPSGRL